MSLANRSITSASWNISVSLISVAILFGRSVTLARLLPVETFGIYAGSTSLVVLTGMVASFGMGDAFLHRAPETQDEQIAASVHFMIKAIFLAIWALILIGGSLVFSTGETRTAIIILTLATVGRELTQTPRLILMRRVIHRRLAVLNLLNVLLTTAIAVGLAWSGATLWALLATDLVTLTLMISGLYVWRPVWKPRLAWDANVVRYYLKFGSRSFTANVLQRGLDEIDDLWTRYQLGAPALGYYSRAYAFATYPRTILAAPINWVAGGTYAELKDDRLRLSKAFFRTNAFLIRSGFLFAGLLALLSQEFVFLILGEKWLPMIDAFRLMLVFTMLDPIKVTIGNLFVAVGRPDQLVFVRSTQLVVLVAGLVLLGSAWGIVGVAIAVNLMLLVGIGLMLSQARKYVDYSAVRLFSVPTIAMILGLSLAVLALSIPGIPDSLWIEATIKFVVFLAVYGGIHLLLERRETAMMVRMLKQMRQTRQQGR